MHSSMLSSHPNKSNVPAHNKKAAFVVLAAIRFV